MRCLLVVVLLTSLPAETWAQGPSGLDMLDPAAIPIEERIQGQPKEVVAILGTNRGRHTEPICSLAYSPDGKYLAAGGQHGSLRVWHAQTLQEHTAFAAHNREVTAVAFSPDGKVWATASWEHGNDFGPAFEGHVKLWDAATGKPSAVLTGFKNQISHLAFAPDGKRLASVCWNKTVRLWDLTSLPPRLQTELRDFPT